MRSILHFTAGWVYLFVQSHTCIWYTQGREQEFLLWHWAKQPRGVHAHQVGQTNDKQFNSWIILSEVKTNFRTAITIPEKSWCKWVFIDLVQNIINLRESLLYLWYLDSGTFLTTMWLGWKKLWRLRRVPRTSRSRDSETGSILISSLCRWFFPIEGDTRSIHPAIPSESPNAWLHYFHFLFCSCVKFVHCRACHCHVQGPVTPLISTSSQSRKKQTNATNFRIKFNSELNCDSVVHFCKLPSSPESRSSKVILCPNVVPKWQNKYLSEVYLNIFIIWCRRPSLIDSERLQYL